MSLWDPHDRVRKGKLTLEISIQTVELKGQHHKPQFERLRVGFLPGGIKIQKGVQRPLKGQLALIGLEVAEKPLKPRFR